MQQDGEGAERSQAQRVPCSDGCPVTVVLVARLSGGLPGSTCQVMSIELVFPLMVSIMDVPYLKEKKLLCKHLAYKTR